MLGPGAGGGRLGAGHVADLHEHRAQPGERPGGEAHPRHRLERGRRLAEPAGGRHRAAPQPQDPPERQRQERPLERGGDGRQVVHGRLGQRLGQADLAVVDQRHQLVEQVLAGVGEVGHGRLGPLDAEVGRGQRRRRCVPGGPARGRRPRRRRRRPAGWASRAGARPGPGRWRCRPSAAGSWRPRRPARRASRGRRPARPPRPAGRGPRRAGWRTGTGRGRGPARPGHRTRSVAASRTTTGATASRSVDLAHAGQRADQQQAGAVVGRQLPGPAGQLGRPPGVVAGPRPLGRGEQQVDRVRPGAPGLQVPLRHHGQVGGADGGGRRPGPTRWPAGAGEGAEALDDVEEAVAHLRLPGRGGGGAPQLAVERVVERDAGPAVVEQDLHQPQAFGRGHHRPADEGVGHRHGQAAGEGHGVDQVGHRRRGAGQPLVEQHGQPGRAGRGVAQRPEPGHPVPAVVQAGLLDDVGDEQRVALGPGPQAGAGGGVDRPADQRLGQAGRLAGVEREHVDALDQVVLPQGGHGVGCRAAGAEGARPAAAGPRSPPPGRGRPRPGRRRGGRRPPAPGGRGRPAPPGG